MSCPAIDKAFQMAEQQISDDIVKLKMHLANNAYWGRIPDMGGFPLNSGTRIKKIRLSRIGYGSMEVGWQNLVDEGCASNVCNIVPAQQVTHGSTDSFYSLERFRAGTDEICLDLIPFRQIGEMELMHLEDSLKDMAAYFWDEWARSRYIHLCENKYVGFVSANSLTGNDYCTTFDIQCVANINQQNGFMFCNRGPNGTVIDSTYPIDERYVVVNCPVSDIPRITEVTGDLLEQASIDLQYEDNSIPFMDQGVSLIEVNVPDLKMLRRLPQLERIQEAWCTPAVMYNSAELTLKLGIKKIIREMFGLRWDKYGMKFYPDYAYNSTLGTYSPTDPTTWPRFVRVFPYFPIQNPNKTVGYIKNPEYTTAPFGITTIFTPKVFGMRGHPEAHSVGSAVVGEGVRDYSGSVHWVNEYDKKCNPYRTRGHWELHFGAGAEPDRPEFGSAFFHRINHQLALSAVRCDLPLQSCGPDGFTIDCYNSQQSGETQAVGSLGANTISNLNGPRWLI